jgi:hypothetical protein
MKRLFPSLACGLLTATVFQLSAQPSIEPPKVLRIFREDIKEGRSGAHEQSESNFMRAAEKLNYPANILGMTALTGPSQAWFLEGNDSFEAIAKTLPMFESTELSGLDALDGEYRVSSRSWIAVYRPDLSYRSKELMEGLPKARFFNVAILRVRPGHDADLTELGRMAVAADEKSGSDQPLVTYQLVSGGPSGTYLLLAPSPSLKALDGAAERSRAMFQSMGDSGSKRFLKTVSDTILSDEGLLFAINPKMSYVSKEFAAVDPNFWTPKPAEAKPPAKARAKTAAK